MIALLIAVVTTLTFAVVQNQQFSQLMPQTLHNLIFDTPTPAPSLWVASWEGIWDLPIICGWRITRISLLPLLSTRSIWLRIEKWIFYEVLRIWWFTSRRSCPHKRLVMVIGHASYLTTTLRLFQVTILPPLRTFSLPCHEATVGERSIQINQICVFTYICFFKILNLGFLVD